MFSKNPQDHVSTNNNIYHREIGTENINLLKLSGVRGICFLVKKGLEIIGQLVPLIFLLFLQRPVVSQIKLL